MPSKRRNCRKIQQRCVDDVIATLWDCDPRPCSRKKPPSHPQSGRGDTSHSRRKRYESDESRSSSRDRHRHRKPHSKGDSYASKSHRHRDYRDESTESTGCCYEGRRRGGRTKDKPLTDKEKLSAALQTPCTSIVQVIVPPYCMVGAYYSSDQSSEQSIKSCDLNTCCCPPPAPAPAQSDRVEVALHEMTGRMVALETILGQMAVQERSRKAENRGNNGNMTTQATATNGKSNNNNGRSNNNNENNVRSSRNNKSNYSKVTHNSQDVSTVSQRPRESVRKAPETTTEDDSVQHM